MGHLYDNPPLIEALCEFRFQQNSEWDLTLPGLFYQEVRERFPLKREQNTVEFHVRMGNLKSDPGVQGTVTPKVQFYSKDETHLVQLSPGVLTINHLKPYPKWPHFKSLIFEMLSVYSKIAQPSELARIGLRYVNQVQLDRDEMTYRYFNYLPSIPDPIKREPKNILLRAELDFETSNGRLILTFASAPSEDIDGKSYILDLDFVTLDVTEMSLQNAKEWLEVAHNQIELAFEASITDILRARFREVIQ